MSSSSSVNPPSGSPRSESNPAETRTRSGVNSQPPGRSQRAVPGRTESDRVRAAWARSRRCRTVLDPPPPRSRDTRATDASTRSESPIRLDERLRPIAVVDVPVDDQHAIHPVMLPRPPRRQRDRAEQAESHRPIANGVMTRGSHRAEAPRGSTIDRHVHRVDHAARGGRRRIPRARLTTVSPSTCTNSPASASVWMRAMYAASWTRARSALVAWRPSTWRSA